MFRKNNKGFTLIELLIVIAIIGVLTSVVFAVVKSAKIKARNAKRLSDIHQYETALELYHTDHGGYPYPDTIAVVCLGDYLNNKCGQNINYNTTESTTLNNILSQYMPKLPADEMVIRFTKKWTYKGYVYGCFEQPRMIAGLKVCDEIQVAWFMEGKNQRCGSGAGNTVDKKYPATKCHIVK